MRPPHPTCIGGMAVFGLAGSLVIACLRLWPATLRFPHDEPHGTGVPAWRVDLDHAGPDELELLPGVGRALAARIVQDRAARGAFGGPEGLDRVPGIGAAVIERVRPFVR